MPDKLSKRTKKQTPGNFTPHTAALDNTDSTIRSGHRFSVFFPKLRRSVLADSLEEADKAINKKVTKQESGDGK